MTPAQTLAYNWLKLPFHERIKIEQELGMPDFSLEQQERDEKVFRWVKENGKIPEFTKRVSSMYHSHMEWLKQNNLH